MASNTIETIDKTDLICPITYQVFRDPVVAGDGHVYERSAIVRWIEEHGTSPLTRQTLNINELQEDEYLKKLAAQRQNSSTSSTSNANLDHTDYQKQSSIIPNNPNLYIDEPVVLQPYRLEIPSYMYPNNNIHPVNIRCKYYCYTMAIIGFICAIYFLLSHFISLEHVSDAKTVHYPNEQTIYNSSTVVCKKSWKKSYFFKRLFLHYYKQLQKLFFD